jgi:HYDIN/CFA65/VesB-like, Ig-like domain
VGSGPGPTALADGIWNPAVELGTQGGDERGARVAVGPDGELTAVWDHFDGSHFVIQERRIGEGGSPPGPVHQLSASGGDAFDARVVVDSGGTATVVWKRFDGSDFVIQERRIDSGGTPEASVHDLSLAGQFAGQPQVAARPDGGAVVVWERHDTARDVTRIQSAVVRPDGTPTACCSSLTDATANRNAMEPQVAVAPDNSAVVVWDRNDTGNQIVQARKIASTGAPAASTYDLSAAGEDAIEPEVAIAPSGKAIVTWARFDGTAYRVQARRLNGAGEPEASTFDLSEAGDPAVQPHVVALPDGSASAVWNELDGATFAVKVRRLGSDGVPATSTYTLSEPGSDAHEPQVGVGSDGSQTVAWGLATGSGSVIQARRIGPDGVPAVATADLSDAGATGTPIVAAGGSSSAAVVWRRFDGVRDHVQVAAFGVPVASLSPDHHDFGSRAVGAGPSPPRAFTVSNPGSTEMKISSVALEGVGAGQFKLQDPTSCGGALLAPGSSCEVSVVFEPSVSGYHQAQLRVESDAYSGSDLATVSGTGLPTKEAVATVTGHAPADSADNRFLIRRVKFDRKHGTASMSVWVPGPGSLRASGKGLRVSARAAGRPSTRAVVSTTREETVVLRLAAAGAKRRALLRRGSVKVLAKVSYLPTGGSRRLEARALKLRLNAPSRSRSGR